MFISMQDKPRSYAVGAQLCIVGFRGQILAFLPRSAFYRETKPNTCLWQALKKAKDLDTSNAHLQSTRCSVLSAARC